MFTFVLTHFRIIDIGMQNVVQQKLYMFLAVSIFATLLSVMKSIRRKCPIDTWKSINSGLLIGLFAFIGNTIFWDLYYMPETSEHIKNAGMTISLEVLIGLIIASTITFGRILRYIFYVNDCDF